MTLTILLVALGGLALAALRIWFLRARVRQRRRNAIEYYLGWGGYTHPIGLQNRITKEAAEACHAEGTVYLVGHYDGEGRLTRAVKFWRGEVFFEYLYGYHPNGRLRRARVARGGRVTVLEYDARGRRVSDASIAF
jgi:hypothetical protein